MSRTSPKTSSFRLDRALDFIYDQDCVIPQSERQQHEELALLQPTTKKIVLNYRASRYGCSLVDALSTGSDVPSSIKKPIKSNKTINKPPSDVSTTVMHAQSPVVRAQFEADVAGISRYKYFYRPLSSTQSARSTSVPITNFQIKANNIDKTVSDAEPIVANRNSEPADSTSSGYQSLKGSNESRSTATSDSARRVNRRRAARLLLQKSIIDRLHYSHTSRSTSRSTDDKLNCRRCWRHASPSNCSSDVLDNGLLSKSTSLPSLNARGSSLGSVKRRQERSARKSVKSTSRSLSSDRLPRAQSRTTRKEYPTIVVKRASTDEQTAMSLLQKYDAIRADLDKKMEEISLNKGGSKSRKHTLVRMSSRASQRALDVLEEDIEGVALNNDPGVEVPEEATQETRDEAGIEAAPIVDFSEAEESPAISVDMVFSENESEKQKSPSDNNSVNQMLFEGKVACRRITPDILIEGEKQTNSNDDVFYNNANAQSESRTSSEDSPQSVVEVEQANANEAEIMSYCAKYNENGQFAVAEIDATTNDEAGMQRATKDAETCTDDIESQEQDSQTETDSSLEEEQSLDDEVTTPRQIMRATQTVLIRENGELEEFEFIKNHVREDLHALIDAALHETVDSYSRHRANEQFAQYIKKHADAWKDVKTFIGSTLLPESIFLAMKEPVPTTVFNETANANLQVHASE